MTFNVSAAAFDETDEKIERKLDIEGNNRTSVYNVTGYKPVKTELSQVPVPVTGQIPSDLEGVYLRNGTNLLGLHGCQQRRQSVGRKDCAGRGEKAARPRAKPW